MIDKDLLMTRYVHLLLIACTVTLTACAEIEQLMDASPQESTRPPLTYYTWLESVDQETLELERDRLTAQPNPVRPTINLIQRALVYSVPPDANTSDTDTAMELLAVALQEPAEIASPQTPLEREYIAFGRIWQTLLEQQRQYRSVRENQSSDKDQIRELTVKVEQLEKQIQALTTIEQRLIEREQIQGRP